MQTGWKEFVIVTQTTTYIGIMYPGNNRGIPVLKGLFLMLQHLVIILIISIVDSNVY